MTTSIALSGGDIYVAGFHVVGGITHACYWKNGATVGLASDASANSIAILGNDVYVAGYIKNKAVYWKNGKVVYLPGGTGAYSIVVTPL